MSYNEQENDDTLIKIIIIIIILCIIFCRQKPAPTPVEPNVGKLTIEYIG